jgi:hypothetical protein
MVAKDGEDLTAVRYKDSLKRDAAPKDYTAEILSAQCVTIGLCVPVRDEMAYQALFERHGFRLTKAVAFYRVMVIRFEKVPGLMNDNYTSRPATIRFPVPS